MKREIYIVSDLHLGGEPGLDGAPGFQMCPPSTQKQMAAFFGRLPAPSQERDVQLVMAGDIVDFLAEKEFSAFTADEKQAGAKLEQIMNRTAFVWDSLAEFVKGGGALTMLLGNHDIELSLPGIRRLLLARLGEGWVDFIYDNEALAIGTLLIEHGNRFDGWNAVAHGALRAARSRLSRGLEAGSFPEMPGSRLVVDVMNPIKGDYSFVDLLKPEDAGVLPILAGLGAGGIRDVWRLMQNYRKTQSVDYDEEGEPMEETYIADILSEEEKLFALAQDIAAGGDATQDSGINLSGLRDKVTDTVRKLRRKGLKQAFQSKVIRQRHRRAFVTETEVPTYLKSAQAAAKRGFKVIVFGHTHLVKRVHLDDDAVYLNTGTWADLIQVPKTVWGDDEAKAEQVLDEFVNDLEKDDVARWRRSLPTYAKVELDGNAVAGADVYFADKDEVVTDDGIERRFEPKE
jgi:UDP-2,3-diacylglucosamine pyrophosphatase LpxH